VDAGSTAGAPAVKVASSGSRASVAVTVAAPPGRRLVVAKEIFAGWEPRLARRRPVHLRVGFEQILVRRAMDPGCPPPGGGCTTVETTRTKQSSAPPGEWELYSSVAGVWTRWPLLRPVDGQTLAVGRTMDVYVARGQPFRVFVSGRECDNGSLSAHSATSPPSPCPGGTGEFLDPTGDDSPGAVVDDYPSPEAAVGVHSSNARLDGSSCPPANSQGCYRVAYRVTVVP
jgi:hypothetical protein